MVWYADLVPEGACPGREDLFRAMALAPLPQTGRAAHIFTDRRQSYSERDLTCESTKGHGRHWSGARYGLAQRMQTTQQ